MPAEVKLQAFELRVELHSTSTLKSAVEKLRIVGYALSLILELLATLTQT